MSWLGRKAKQVPEEITISVETREVVALQARVKHAGRIARHYLEDQSLLEPDDRNDEATDVVLEMLVALALAPKEPAVRPAVPVVPGRAS